MQHFATQALSSRPVRRACGTAAVLGAVAAVSSFAVVVGQVREARFEHSPSTSGLQFFSVQQLHDVEHPVRLAVGLWSLVTVLEFVAIAVALAVTTRWARRGGVLGLRHGPGMAGWGLLIPVYSYVVLAHTAHDLRAGAEWDDAAGPRRPQRSVRLWWGSLLVSNLLLVVARAMAAGGDSTGRHVVLALAFSAWVVFAVVTVVVMASLVRRYDDRETRLQERPSRWNGLAVHGLPRVLAVAAGLLVVAGLVVAAAQTVSLPRVSAAAPASRTAQSGQHVSFRMHAVPLHGTRTLAAGGAGDVSYEFWATPAADRGRGELVFSYTYDHPLDPAAAEDALFTSTVQELGATVTERTTHGEGTDRYEDGVFTGTSGRPQGLRVLVSGRTAVVVSGDLEGLYGPLVASVSLR